MPEYYMPSDLIVRYALIDVKFIGYVNSLVESYEDIGQVRTYDNKRGIIIFWIMPDFKNTFFSLIKEFQKDIELLLFPENWKP